MRPGRGTLTRLRRFPEAARAFTPTGQGAWLRAPPGAKGPMPAQQTGRQAPSLRRCARALAGSQAEGGGLAQSMMEALPSGVVPLAGNLPLRSGLYRALLEIWRERQDHPDAGAG